MFLLFYAWLMLTPRVGSLFKFAIVPMVHKDAMHAGEPSMTMEHRESAMPAGTPGPEGLYDPAHEHDACGVGFVVDIKGRKSHTIVSQALQVLKNLAHRGACGCEVNTGDGAGILMQIPDRFLRKVGPAPLPQLGEYGVGLIFLPQDPSDRRKVENLFEEIADEEGQRFLGWRDVPTNDSPVGPSAVAVEPFFRHAFIGKSAATSVDAFERKLYVIR